MPDLPKVTQQERGKAEHKIPKPKLLRIIDVAQTAACGINDWLCRTVRNSGRGNESPTEIPSQEERHCWKEFLLLEKIYSFIKKIFLVPSRCQALCQRGNDSPGWPPTGCFPPLSLTPRFPPTAWLVVQASRWSWDPDGEPN